MKKTKKFLVGLLSLIVMLTCPLALTSCKKECKEHTWGDWTEVTASTCTQEGTKTHKCTKCQHEESAPIEALGHDYQTPTYVWSNDSLTCTASRICSHDESHVESETATAVFVGTPATCETPGNGHYEATFTNTAFVKQQTQDAPVDALTHDYVVVYVWSQDNLSCTATATCAHDNTHVVTETADSIYEVVTPAECEQEGEGKYTVTFDDTTLFTIQEKTVAIDALEHTYGTPVYVWTEEVVGGVTNSTCVATRTCGRNSEHVETETKTVVMQVTTPAECEKDGAGLSTVVFTNPAFGTQTKEYVIDALGHDLSKDAANSQPATCKVNGFDHMTCSRCSYTEDNTVLASTVDHTWVGIRDCENSRTCSVCDTTEPAFGHNTVYDKDASTPATCEEDGKRVYSCQNTGCSYSYFDTLPHTGHNIEGVTPTARPVDGKDCTYVNVYICKNGNHEVLGTEFVKHNHIASIKTPATCEEGGEKTYTCTVCGDTYDEPYAASSTAHDWVESTTEEGHFACSHCSATKVVLDNSTSAQAVVSKETISATSEIVLSNAAITVDSTTLSNATGDVTFVADKIEGDSRNEILANHTDVADQIGDKPIYDFSMTDSTGNVDFSESSVTITIPYTLGENEDVDSIYVWYLNDNGEVDTIKATYHNGTIIFTTNHFSYYTTINLEPEQICEQKGEHAYGSETVVEPTCLEAGYTVKVCGRCGHVEHTNPQPATGHSFSRDTENSYDATCTTAGQNVMSCHCGASMSSVIPATGHSHVLDDINSTDPACGVAGQNIYVCEHDNCTDSYVEFVVALEHIYDDGVYTAHTQTEVGYTTYSCTRSDCDHSYKVEDEVIEHTYNVEHATCGTDKVCTVCGLVVENHEDLEHTYDDGVYTPHTQTEVGYTTYTCSVCEHSYKEEDETIAHEYDEGVYTPHTKTEKGYKIFACLVCGHSYKIDDEIIEHTYNVEHATCETDKVCTECGLVVENHEDVAHDYVDGVCSVCEHACEHGLGDNELNSVDATCEDEGYTYYTCDDCGEEVVHETFEALGHEGDAIVCTRCEKEIISKEVFVNAFEYLSGNDFTLKLENVALTVENEYNKTEVSLPFTELYIGKDSAGSLYAFGTFIYNSENMDYIDGQGIADTQSTEASALIMNNKLYIKAVLDGGNSGYSSSSGGKHYEYVEDQELYACIEIRPFIEYIISMSTEESDIPEGVITVELLNTVLDWCKESLLPYVDNIVEKNSSDAIDALMVIANDLFYVTVTDEGYTFQINSASISRLFKDITELSIEEYINKRLGENAFDSIIEGAIELLISGKTVGDVMDYLATRGLDVYAFIDVLNLLIPELTGGMTLDDIVYMMMQSSQQPEYDENMTPEMQEPNQNIGMMTDETEEPAFSLKEYIAQYEAIELREIFLGLVSDGDEEVIENLTPYLYPDLETTTIEDMVTTIKTIIDMEINPYVSDVTIFELIVLISSDAGDNEQDYETGDKTVNTYTTEESIESTQPTQEEIIAQIYEMIAMLDEFFSFEINTSLTGEFKSFNFTLNTPVAQATFNASLVVGPVTDIDYEAMAEEIEEIVAETVLTKDNIGESFSSIGFENILDEEGNLVGFEKEFTAEEIEEIGVCRDENWTKDEKIVTEMVFSSLNMVIDISNPLYAIQESCSGVYNVSPLYNVTYTASYVVTTSYYKKEYSNEWTEDHTYWDGDVEMYYGWTIADQGYEQITDEVVTYTFSFDYYYILSEDKVTNVEMYVEYENNYVCWLESTVFDETLYEDDGHVYELVSQDVATTCTGVSTYNYTCTVCGKKKVEKVVKGHSFNWDDNTYVLAEGGDDCCKDGVYLVQHCTTCGETETSDYVYSFSHHTNPTNYGGEEYGMILKVCPCGKEVYFSVLDYDKVTNTGTSTSNGYTYTYVSGNLKIRQEYSYDDYTYVYKVYVSNTLVQTYVDIY